MFGRGTHAVKCMRRYIKIKLNTARKVSARGELIVFLSLARSIACLGPKNSELEPFTQFN